MLRLNREGFELTSNREGIPLKSNKNSIFFLFGSLILAAIAFAALPSRSQGISTWLGQRPGDEYQMPIADFALPEPTDAKERALRNARGSRYNNRGQKPIAELALGTEPLPLNNHWWWSIPALPVNKSDAIVIGEVLGAQAYLSSDKTGIYSEFRIDLSEMVKNASGATLVSRSEVIATREGGIVRFPSGRQQRYSTVQQGMPMVGRGYLFFLKCNGSGQDFSLLTAYELRNGRVLPLDGYGDKGERRLTDFTKFEGMDETVFLKAVADAISNSPQDLSEKGQEE